MENRLQVDVENVGNQSIFCSHQDSSSRSLSERDRLDKNMIVCCFERQKIQNLPYAHKLFYLAVKLLFEIFRTGTLG